MELQHRDTDKHWCSYCGLKSDIPLSRCSIGTAGAILKEQGWSFKSGFFLTGKSDFMLFCSPECLEKGWAAYKEANQVEDKMVIPNNLKMDYDGFKRAMLSDVIIQRPPVDFVDAFVKSHISISARIQAAAKKYEKLNEERDVAMYEQIPHKYGETINGHRLNTPALPKVNLEVIASEFDVTPQDILKFLRQNKKPL